MSLAAIQVQILVIEMLFAKNCLTNRLFEPLKRLSVNVQVDAQTQCSCQEVTMLDFESFLLRKMICKFLEMNSGHLFAARCPANFFERLFKTLELL